MTSIGFALASAFASAWYVLTQHVASTGAPAREKGWRLALYLVRDRLWLFGAAAMVAAFVLQAVALFYGRESVVQSVLVSELVFSLVIGRLWLRRTVVVAAWASASLTSAGLAVFLVMSEPKGGHVGATRSAWLPALLTFGVITAALALLARNPSPSRRAACYASASGITGAVTATFLKSVTESVGHQGAPAALVTGALYGLIAIGVVGMVFTQAALHHGPLVVAQPLMLIVNPVVSIILGIWIFGEQFEGGWWKVAVGLSGFTVMALGIIFLARTAPSLAAAPSEP